MSEECKQIAFSEITISEGRNGTVKTSGISLDTRDSQLNLRPVTSKGGVASHVAVALPQDPEALLQLSAELQRLAVDFDAAKPRLIEMLSTEALTPRFERLFSKHAAKLAVGRHCIRGVIREGEGRTELTIEELPANVRDSFEMLNQHPGRIEMLIEIQKGTVQEMSQFVADAIVATLQVFGSKDTAIQAVIG